MVLGNMRRLRRLVLARNDLLGPLDGLLPCAAMETMDLSNNAGLWGPLPGGMHARWISGDLPCNAAGTRIGSTEDGRPLTPVRRSEVYRPVAGALDDPTAARSRPARPAHVLSHEDRQAVAAAHMARALAQQRDLLAKLNIAAPLGPPQVPQQQLQPLVAGRHGSRPGTAASRARLQGSRPGTALGGFTVGGGGGGGSDDGAAASPSGIVRREALPPLQPRQAPPTPKPHATHVPTGPRPGGHQEED